MSRTLIARSSPATRMTLFMVTTALFTACADAPTSAPRAPSGELGPHTALGPKPLQGRIAYASTVSGENHIYVYDHASRTTKRLTDNPAGANTEPNLSPDGRRVVWLRIDAGLHLWASNTDGTKLERLTAQPEPYMEGPSYSPDTKRLVVTANNKSTGVAHLHLFDLKTRQFTPIGDPNVSAYGADWSPDGKRIAYAASNGVRQVLFTMNADGTDVEELVNACPVGYSCKYPRWSPDGTQIAFEAAGNGIWVYRFATDASQQQVADAQRPMWSPDGTKLGFHRATQFPFEATMFMVGYPVPGLPEQLLAGLVSLHGTDWSR